MADQQVFNGVTQAIFDCMKVKSQQEHGTVYDPPNANAGTATTSTSTYKVELGFSFDPASGALTYTLKYKTWIVPISSVWSGIGDTIDSCRQEHHQPPA